MKPPPIFFCIFLHLNLNNFFVLNDRGAFYISKCRYIKCLYNKIKLTSMGFRVWVLDIQNPKNRNCFRKILNSNLNNYFVLTDRRTFYIQKCRYCRYLSNKKDLISMGCRVWVLWPTKIRKIWENKTRFFYLFQKSNILTTIVLLFIMTYLNL